MAPRRSHKKSRTGCQRCKRRRIKCDEIHPSCTNCVKHAIVCDFSLPPDEQRAVLRELQSAPRVAAAGQMMSPESVASSPASHLVSHRSPAPAAQQPSNMPALGRIISDNMPSPAPSPQVHHQRSPGVHGHGAVPRATSRSPSMSPATPSSMIEPSSGGGGGGGGHTTSSPYLHISGGKVSPGQALSPPPSSVSSSFATPTNQLVLPSFHTGLLNGHQSAINMLDLTLMHHWSVKAGVTITNHTHIKELWRVQVPSLATRHPFLMHALLAISALHLNHENAEPSKSNLYLSTASQHHEYAVRGTADCLAHISRDNCDALVVSSCLVVIYSFITSRIDEVGSHGPSQIASWVPLLRGVHSILKQVWHWVSDGPLSPLLHQYKRTTSDDRLDPEAERIIQSLYGLCRDRSLPGSNELSDAATSTAYMTAIAGLRRSFTIVAEGESSDGNIFVWLVDVSAKYVELLAEHRPRAMVIFLHFCALFSLAEGFWWSKGSALFELRKCEQYLTEEWLPWIEWPKQRILTGEIGPEFPSFTRLGKTARGNSPRPRKLATQPPSPPPPPPPPVEAAPPPPPPPTPTSAAPATPPALPSAVAAPPPPPPTMAVLECQDVK